MKISVRPGELNVEAMVFALREEVGKRLGPRLALEIEVTEQFHTSLDGKTPTFKRLLKPVPGAATIIKPDLNAR
jgi:hypothetical protein